MSTLEKIKAEIEQIKPYELPCDKRTPEHIKDMALKIIDKYAEQEPKILDTIDYAIDTSNGDTNYFVGFRNGLRYAKSLVDGEEPQYENCKVTARQTARANGEEDSK